MIHTRDMRKRQLSPWASTTIFESLDWEKRFGKLKSLYPGRPHYLTTGTRTRPFFKSSFRLDGGRYLVFEEPVSGFIEASFSAWGLTSILLLLHRGPIIVPEPYGYAVVPLISSIQKTVPCGRRHVPVHMPPSSLLTSLDLLVRGLLLEITGGRREEEGEGRRKWGRRAQPEHLGCLLAVWLLVLLLSAIWSATLYPPSA